MNEYILLFISLFVLSISLNIFLVWYARKPSSRLTVVASNIDEIMTSLEDFENHLCTKIIFNDNGCKRCGNSSHFENECYAKKDIFGNYIEKKLI